MKIHILLRTHDRRSVHPVVRTIQASKQEIVLRSAYSLAKTIEQSEHDCRVTLIDDHSSQKTVSELRKIFAQSQIPTEFVALEGTGNNTSMKLWFSMAKDSDSDLVYCAEDDYLHIPEALDSMIEAYSLFKSNLSQEVAIHPLDDPHAYRPEFISPCRVVLGPTMHWRTVDGCACPMLLSPKLIEKHWCEFDRMARLYGTQEGQKNNIHEGTTISKIWRSGEAFLFIPLKPLAIHLNEWPQHFFASEELWKQNQWIF